MNVSDGRLRPPVTPPRAIVPVPVMIAVAGVLAVGLFVALEARRAAAPATATTAAEAMPAPVADLAIPPAPGAAQIVIHDRGAAALPVGSAPGARIGGPLPARVDLARARAPLPLFGDGQGVTMPSALMPPPGASPGAASPGPAAPVNRTPALVLDFTTGAGIDGGGGKPGGDSSDDTVQATLIRNRASVIAQGTLMTAILETPLDSDRPGIARAVVSADVRGFDGSRVLIPRGSRLIGSFKAEGTPALRRVPVIWERLIRPDGVAIRIASPAADALGGAGIPGAVDSHFAARLAGAVLQSALMVGVNVASEMAAGSGGTWIGLPAQGTQIGTQLVPGTARAPTVKVRGGTAIAILVAHDLDFSGTPAVR